jgi:hypothetical protein
VIKHTTRRIGPTSLLLCVHFIRFLQRRQYSTALRGQFTYAGLGITHKYLKPLGTIVSTTDKDGTVSSSHSFHTENACLQSRKKRGRWGEKQSLILIALKCHKYAPTVLIFYGNRKSIRRHQSHPLLCPKLVKRDRQGTVTVAHLHKAAAFIYTVTTTISRFEKTTS